MNKVPMRKITISIEAYNLLNKFRRDNETFSDAIIRLCERAEFIRKLQARENLYPAIVK
ncbi:MAG: antitoxin VapB family protein [Nanoarchaeota archaeon]